MFWVFGIGKRAMLVMQKDKQQTTLNKYNEKVECSAAGKQCHDVEGTWISHESNEQKIII